MHKGYVISDIHIGAFDLEKASNELSEVFLTHIEKSDFDFLVITGDYFDHKFFLNDKESSVAYKLMRDIINVCKTKNAKLRIVYGTESHECNQYDILSLLDLYDEVRVIKYAEEEDLFDDLKVLYIPEEHVFDKDEYYHEFLSKENYYDYVFGHGVIREVMTNAVVHMENKESKSGKSKHQKVPIFSSSELSYCCKGQVFFGHYHINQNINDKVFYVGSFSRWQFGEESDKGFYEIECNKNKYKSKFIENTMAEKFVTIGYGYDNEVFESVEKMDHALTKIDNMIKDKVFDHVRFEFNVPENIENPESTISYIKNRYKFSKDVKLEIVHGYVAKKKERQNEEIDETSKKYSFIDDKSLGLEQKVSRFIAIEYSKDVPLTRTEKYLHLPLNEILDLVNDTEFNKVDVEVVNPKGGKK